MSRNFLTPVVLPAGTASNAPLSLQPGTNLTAAAAGAVEYDGKVIYSTPNGRGVSPSMMLYRLNSGLAGANATGVQSILGVGVTLNASTIYEYEAAFAFTKTTGATSHSFGQSFGGTATLNNIYTQIATSSSAIAPPTNQTCFLGSTLAATNTYWISSIGVTTVTVAMTIRGTVSINAGGTLIPQYQLSSAPGGAYTTAAGSYFAIWPIGASGANVSVGLWA
jgi:hypothetical protein